MAENLPFRKPGHVYAVNAHYWDFNIERGKLGIPIENTTESDRWDLHLTKNNVDYINLRDTSLFSVGGYLHYHDGNENGIWIENGVKTLQNIESNHVGIINFEEVNGKVNLYKLSNNDIIKIDDRGDWHNSVVIRIATSKLPRANRYIYRSSKQRLQVGLVICGELYWLGLDSNIFTCIEDNANYKAFKVDLQRWHILEKVFKYSKLFDLRTTPYIDGRIKVDEVFRNEKLVKRLFTIPQSFLVIVEPTTVKNIQLSYQYISSNQLPKRYFTDKSVFHYQPLRLSDGTYPPYYAYDDRNGVVVCTEFNKIYPQQGDTLNRWEQAYIHEIGVSSRPGHIREAKLLNGVEVQ